MRYNCDYGKIILVHYGDSFTICCPTAGAEASEEVQNAVAVFLSQATSPAAAQTLTRILHNICSQPDNAKFRSLKMSNPKIKASVLEAPGALEMLEVRFAEHA